MDFGKFDGKTIEEIKADTLDKTSDTVRSMAFRMAMLKAISYRENDIAPEDFDMAWNREYAKEWEKLKDKDSQELAVIGLLDLLTSGASIDEVFGRGKEE